MADAWPSPDASSTLRIKPDRASKLNLTDVNGKRVATETVQEGHSNEDDGAQSGEEPSQRRKVKPEKKPEEKGAKDDGGEEEDDDEPKSRKRLKAANGRPRHPDAPDLDGEEDEIEGVRPATKIFVRDPKDGQVTFTFNPTSHLPQAWRSPPWSLRALRCCEKELCLLMLLKCV
jgi:hypothetical protein